VDGGQGGNQVGSASLNEVEGPGGGGSGGYIAISGGTPTLSAIGGPAGTTDRIAMTDFAANGATAGNIGQTNGNAATFLYCGFGTSATPVTTIQNHPDSTTTSTTATFTFQATEASVLLGAGEVTFECKLDSATFTSCSSGYAVQDLAGGQHTFTVRATDVASGNVEENPTSVTWMISGFDSGVVTTNDSAPAVDLGVDLGAEDSGEIPLLDAEGIDRGADVLVGELDAGNPDRAPDTIVVIKRDTAPVYTVDGNEGNNDGPVADVLPLHDSGVALDVQALDGAGTFVLVDAQSSGAETNPDTATIPAQNPDTAVSVIRADAAPLVSDFEVQGSGFCAIASPRSTSPLPFVVLGLAALALFRRRRDGREKP
jgi:MYXO-CTERM domain-containing protein